MRKRVPILAAASVVLFASCGSSTGGSWTNYSVDAPMTTTHKDVWQFNASKSSSAGPLELDGSATVDGAPVHVSLHALIDYTNGAGAFSESLEFDFGSEGKLYAFSSSGMTTKTPSGVHVAAILRIIGGTGTFEGATGTGTHAADRGSAIGSALTAHFDLHVKHH